jgi:hypothetical protein
MLTLKSQIMKNLKFLTILLVTSIFTFTSCQDEIDDENGTNPNANSANSVTASNLERSAMYDGSFDDFLDGVSCSSILLPVIATINNIQVAILSESDYTLVLDIIGEFTNDDDSIQFQFPLNVRLSNYTELQVSNQSEFNTLFEACEQADNEAEDTITCLDINFPITILTYNASAEQTASVVLESEQQLFNYMTNFNEDELFAVNYPITATLNSETVVEITSDADLQTQITACLATEDAEDEAGESAENLEAILVEGLFVVDTFITAGVDTAAGYAEFTIDFANDLSLKAENTVNATIADVEGTYEVVSELEVFLTLSFSGNASFELLNSVWEVTSYSENSIVLQSTTNAAATLVLAQI